MGIDERLLEDMKSAMKSGKSERLSVIRMARAALQDAKIAKRDDFTEEDALEVLGREVKKRREAAEEYRKLGKEDRAAAEEKEGEILGAYLPEQLTDAEIEELVSGVNEEVGAQSPRELGKVMGAVMPQVKGKAQGREVSAVVSELLKSMNG